MSGLKYMYLYPLLAVNAAETVFGMFCNLRQLLLHSADALGIAAYFSIYQVGSFTLFLNGVLGLLQKLQDEGHTHIFAVESLTEIGCPGIIIHLDADLI